MKPLNEILKKFPFTNIRKIQQKAIEFAYKCFDGGAKYVVLELPTGTGKSAIGITMAEAFNKVFYTTAQKILQDQYERDFSSRIEILKGRGAYRCAKEIGKNAANASCIVEGRKVRRCMEEHCCEYYNQISKTIQAHIGLFNVHSLYFQTEYTDRFPTRDLLVIDECHLLESTFMGFVELRLYETKEVKIPKKVKTVAELIPFMDKMRTVFKNKSMVLADKITESYINKIDTTAMVQEYEALESKIVRIDFVKKQLAEDVDNWVFQVDYNTKNDKYALFKPIYVSKFIRESILKLAGKFIFMSATVIDIDNFCESVGIKREETKFIRSSSPFKVEHRPIYVKSVGSMSYKNKKLTLPKMLRSVEEIIDSYPDDRGIVHTNSFEFMDAIRKNIKDKRLIFKEGSVRQMLREHGIKNNSVIVGPAMVEGLDLKDELCRFQIIMKVPYPSLGDLQIKKRFDISKSWYNYMTVLKIVQAYGRGIRHEKDSADTYILDSDFDRLYKIASKMFPPYFKEAVKRI